MSAFWITCPSCGERYFHMFVGSELLAGHECTATPEQQRLAIQRLGGWFRAYKSQLDQLRGDRKS